MNGKSKTTKRPAYNERFCVIAAVSPQIMQWELASYYPAASSVEAATTPSRHHVRRNAGVLTCKTNDCFSIVEKGLTIAFQLSRKD